MNRTIDEILETFKDFTDGVRVMFLIRRKKEGGSNNKNKRHLNKLISRNSEEFKTNLETLYDIAKEDKNLRIYSSMNDRDINKAVYAFKKEQLDADYLANGLRNDFYYDIKNRFISTLCTPSCRNSKYFLLDFDEICERGMAAQEKKINKVTKIKLMYATKNGYHVITEPFNPNDLKDCPVDIHKDSLLLLAY